MQEGMFSNVHTHGTGMVLRLRPKDGPKRPITDGQSKSSHRHPLASLVVLSFYPIMVPLREMMILRHEFDVSKRLAALRRALLASE